MSERAHAFSVGRYWERSKDRPGEPRAERLRTINPELGEWLDGDPLRSTFDLSIQAVEFEYDTGFVLWDMTIVYADPGDAFHHRMRW